MPAAAELVHSLDPSEEAFLKWEEGTWIWREEHDGEPVVIKMYRLRSRWDALRGRVFSVRAIREHHRLRHLARWGIPCTEPLASAAGHCDQHGFHEVLVMREVPDALQLGEYIRTRGTDVDLAPLFRMVRRMHESGFCHQTLYPVNILARQGVAPEDAYVMSDVPRSWVFPGSIVGTPMAAGDLRDLAWGLMQEGVPPESLPLDAYGDTPGLDLGRELKSGRNPKTKRRRLVRDIDARLRWTLALGWLRSGRRNVDS